MTIRIGSNWWGVFPLEKQRQVCLIQCQGRSIDRCHSPSHLLASTFYAWRRAHFISVPLSTTHQKHSAES
jgi:hypothetical protein